MFHGGNKYSTEGLKNSTKVPNISWRCVNCMEVSNIPRRGLTKGV